MSRFEVTRGQKYLITERPNSSTPAPLKKLGRMKMTKTSEPIFCIYDDKRKAYDTGLNRFSREFDGMSEEQRNKVLEERKPLIDYLESLIEGSGKSETEFLAEYALNVSHNITIDTSNMDNYLRLYLATRGIEICPVEDHYNPTYNGALYQIESRENTRKREEIVAEMRMEAVQWLLAKLQNNREEALDFLKYADVINLGHDKKKNTLLFQTFEKKIDSDYKLLEYFVDIIQTKTWEEVKTHNVIKKAIISRKIAKDAGGYTFNGRDIGKDVREIVKNIKKPEFAEVAFGLLGEEEPEEQE